MLLCVAVCCCVLLCVDVCCCVLLCVAVCCCVLLCAAVCCCVLLCAALCTNLEEVSVSSECVIVHGAVTISENRVNFHRASLDDVSGVKTIVVEAT